MKEPICHLLLLVILFLNTSIFGQNCTPFKIDSILNLAERSEDDKLAYAIAQSFKAYDKSRKINYEKGMAQALIVASRKQYEMGKYKDVLKNATEAEHIAKNIFEDKELSDALRLKGIAYTGLGSFKKGREELDEALTVASRLEDREVRSSRLGVLYNDIAYNIDKNKGSLDSVAYFYQRGYSEFARMNLNSLLKKRALSFACSNVGSSFLRAKELDSAEYYLKRALRLANSINHNFVEANVINDLGSLYYIRKQYHQSIDYFKNSLEISKGTDNIETVQSSYIGLYKSYMAIGDEDNYKKYFDLHVRLDDSLASFGDNYIIKSSIVSTDTLKNSIKSKRFILLVATIVFVVISIIFTAFDKSRKVVLVEENKDTTEIVPIKIIDDNSIIVKKLVELGTADSPDFLNTIKEHYPEFFEKLFMISPTLILGEQKLCAFLKLDFSTKKIAQVTKSSVRGVEAKKYRLRKKLMIPSEVDLNLWMMGL